MKFNPSALVLFTAGLAPLTEKATARLYCHPQQRALLPSYHRPVFDSFGRDHLLDLFQEFDFAPSLPSSFRRYERPRITSFVHDLLDDLSFPYETVRSRPRLQMIDPISLYHSRLFHWDDDSASPLLRSSSTSSSPETPKDEDVNDTLKKENDYTTLRFHVDKTFEPNDISIRYDERNGGTVTVRGSRKVQTDNRAYRSVFEKTFALNGRRGYESHNHNDVKGVDWKNMNASMEDGVITLKAPRINPIVTGAIEKLPDSNDCGAEIKISSEGKGDELKKSDDNDFEEGEMTNSIDLEEKSDVKESKKLPIIKDNDTEVVDGLTITTDGEDK